MYAVHEGNTGHALWEGDAADDEILKTANLQDAKAMITTLPVDADNLFAQGTREQIDQLIRTVSTNGS